MTEDRRTPGRGFAAACAASLVAAVTAIVIGDTILPAGTEVSLIGAQLDAAVLAVTMPLAVLFILRWRLTTEAAAAWLGTGLGLYGLVTVGLGRVLSPTVSVSGEVVDVLPAAARIVAIALIVAALAAPQVDASLDPVRLGVGALAATALLAGVLSQLPHALPPVAAVATGWSLAGLASLIVGFRERRHLLTWCGLGLLMLGVANATAIGAEPGSVSGLAAPVLRILGLIWALTGAARGLVRAFLHQRGRLFASLTAELVAESEAEARRAHECERVHEARNALATIEAATLALGFQTRPDDPDVAMLTKALRSEIRRLSGLVDPQPTPVAPSSPFSIRDVVTAVAAAARAHGSAVTTDVLEDVWASGDAAQTTQVLHNLLQNARRYGGRSIHIGACSEGAQVVVRVVDDGPGIPEAERATIFERGTRGSTAVDTAGDGLGLFIASRLMAEQAGDLRLEDRQEPGACFAVALPAASPLAQEVVDEGQERRQVAVAS